MNAKRRHNSSAGGRRHEGHGDTETRRLVEGSPHKLDPGYKLLGNPVGR